MICVSVTSETLVEPPLVIVARETGQLVVVITMTFVVYCMLSVLSTSFDVDDATGAKVTDEAQLKSYVLGTGAGG